VTARNDITGDALRSKPNSDKYRDNYDRIFKKNRAAIDDAVVGSSPAEGERVAGEGTAGPHPVGKGDFVR